MTSIANLAGEAVPTPSAALEGRPKSIVGVDSMRLVAALWVAFGHGARLPVPELLHGRLGVFAKVATGLSNMMFNGVDAVIIFFLVSGLCIHYPNVGRDGVNAARFIARRFIRVGVPLTAIVILTFTINKEYFYSIDVVLWTVYCELIYYLIYPLLFILGRKYRWTRVLAASSAISALLLVFGRKNIFLWQFGYLTWLYCLPFWLLGVVLAERFTLVASSMPRLWAWRAGAVAHGIVATTLIYHSPVVVGLVWTVPPFAVYCYFWLQRELEHFRHGVSPLLETLGLASYSIYLTHKIAITFMASHLLKLGLMSRWAIQLGLIFAVAALFYFMFERPSHRLARQIGLKRGRLAPATVAGA